MIEQTLTATPAARSVQYAVLSNDGLAFDHAKIIAYAIERLRQETERTGIALLLMPEQFTLAELQQVYELILGQEIPKAVFLDKMAALITATNLYTEPTEHTLPPLVSAELGRSLNFRRKPSMNAGRAILKTMEFSHELDVLHNYITQSKMPVRKSDSFDKQVMLLEEAQGESAFQSTYKR